MTAGPHAGEPGALLLKLVFINGAVERWVLPAKVATELRRACERFTRNRSREGPSARQHLADFDSHRPGLDKVDLLQTTLRSLVGALEARTWRGGLSLVFMAHGDRRTGVFLTLGVTFGLLDTLGEAAGS